MDFFLCESVNQGCQEFYGTEVAALHMCFKASITFSSKNWEYKETKPHSTFEQDRNETKEREKTRPRETELTRFKNFLRHSQVDFSNCDLS